MMASTVNVPAPPPLATAIFGDRLPLACRFASWLVGAGVERGLVGPRETERIWDRHLLNCAAVGALVPPGAIVVDIGSGAGLPGLPLAIARPDLTVVLVESMLRRTTFLSEVVADLGLSTVSVQRARAEELTKTGFADVVTARAVAPIDKLARWALPLAKDRGVVLALKGAGAAEELASAGSPLRRAGVADARLMSLVEGGSETSFIPGVEVRQVAPPPESTPDGELFNTGQIALVVALSRFPQALSRAASIGLG
jgi:16S rRNA (guanine527-N7)-methyltransferase